MALAKRGLQNEDRAAKWMEVSQAISVLSTTEDFNRGEAARSWRIVVDVNSQFKGKMPEVLSNNIRPMGNCIEERSSSLFSENVDVALSEILPMSINSAKIVSLMSNITSAFELYTSENTIVAVKMFWSIAMSLSNSFKKHSW